MQKMSEKEALQDIQFLARRYNDLDQLNYSVKQESFDMAIQALEEIQQYRAFEQRLKNVYGDCDGLLEVTVSSLERHENLELPCIKVKSRLIVDEDVDKWDEYRAIGSVDECREAVERMKPKMVLIKPWSEAKCPTCGKSLSTNEGDGYYTHWTHIERCPNVDCSQRLMWEE